MGYPENHKNAPLISRHMRDLLKRPVRAVRECAEDPNTERDYSHREHSKGLAARAVAARYILKAIEGSAAHGDTLLERVEGKVISGDATSGALINFNFVVQGEAGVRQVGELVNGAIAAATTNSMQSEQGLAQPGIQAGIKPTPRSTPTINPPLALPASPDQDAEDK